MDLAIRHTNLNREGLASWITLKSIVQQAPDVIIKPDDARAYTTLGGETRHMLRTMSGVPVGCYIRSVGETGWVVTYQISVAE